MKEIIRFTAYDPHSLFTNNAKKISLVFNTIKKELFIDNDKSYGLFEIEEKSKDSYNSKSKLYIIGGEEGLKIAYEDENENEDKYIVLDENIYSSLYELIKKLSVDMVNIKDFGNDVKHL